MLFFDRQDTLLSLSPAQRQEAIERLIAATTLRKGYYLLLLLSVLIVSAGLLVDSPAVIIGGMVIAPLLLPVLSLSLSLTARSVRGTLHSLSVLIMSIGISYALSYVVARSAALTDTEILWIPETISPSLSLLIALCSGVAAAFAWVKEDIAPTIAGIAISVSLLPPICAAGIATALHNLPLAEVSLRIFALNIGGMLLAAILSFTLLGFATSGKQTEKIVEKATKN